MKSKNEENIHNIFNTSIKPVILKQYSPFWNISWNNARYRDVFLKMCNVAENREETINYKSKGIN